MERTEHDGTDPPRGPVIQKGGQAWDRLYAALRPTLGPDGFTALYRESLARAADHHPWLEQVRLETRLAGDFGPLERHLGARADTVAERARRAIRRQFDCLLDELLGPAMSARLARLAADPAPADTGAPPEAIPPTPAMLEQLLLATLQARAEARMARRERDRARLDGQRDALTGTANRRLMFDRLAGALALARRNDTPMGVIFIDLDGFKDINDNRGHGGGDDVLRGIARRLVSAVRATDTVCRYGGDEFVVILTPMRHSSQVEPAVTRILAAIADPKAGDDADNIVSASVGVALYPDDGTEPEQLLAVADQAMYRNKQDKRPGRRERVPVRTNQGGRCP